MAVKQQSTITDGTITQIPVAAQREAPHRRENSPFQYWLDPASVRFVDGEPVYALVRVDLRPGAQGGKPNGDPTASDGYQTTMLRRIKVPLDFAVTAWGEAHTGYLIREVIGEDRRGKQMIAYREPWERWRRVGSMTIREYDQAGYDKFCRDVSRWHEAPDEQIVEMARAQSERRAATLEESHPKRAVKVRARTRRRKKTTTKE